MKETHKNNTLSRCSNSQQSQLSQHHHQEATAVYRLERTAHKNTAPAQTYIIPLVLSTTGVILNKLHYSLKLLNICPALYILLQPATALNICRMVRKRLAGQWVRSAWLLGPVPFWELAELLPVQDNNDDAAAAAAADDDDDDVNMQHCSINSCRFKTQTRHRSSINRMYFQGQD